MKRSGSGFGWATASAGASKFAHDLTHASQMKPESPAIRCATSAAVEWQNWHRPSETKRVGIWRLELETVAQRRVALAPRLFRLQEEATGAAAGACGGRRPRDRRCAAGPPSCLRAAVSRAS